MEGAYPDLCKELYAWAPTGAPTLAIEVLGKVQFDLYCPGMSYPPQTSEVAKASYMHTSLWLMHGLLVNEEIKNL